MVTIKKVRDDFSKQVDKWMDRSKSFQGAAARIYPMYQRFQTERFKSEGSSEGMPWDPIQEPYKTYKKSRYGGGERRGGGHWKTFPGAGSKTLIATSTLAGAVIGPGAPFVSEGISKHRAVFTSSRMEISVISGGENAEGRPFNYAAAVNEERPFMEFSKTHINEMKEELRKFILA